MGPTSTSAHDEPVPAMPLVVTSDDVLLEKVQRVAATVGVETEPVVPTRARAAWAAASLVVVGSDQLATLVELVLPRRPGVVVVEAGSGLLQPSTDDVALWQRAMALGAERVVRLPDDDAWLASRLGELHAGPVTATVVGVVGAVGGCGCSTLAAALAVVAADSGQCVLLVDTDELGGGLDLLLGAEDEDGSRWPQLSGARGTVTAATLHEVLPSVPDVPRLQVLSCARTSVSDTPWPAAAQLSDDAFAAVLTGAVRGFDLVVVDLGRGEGAPSAAMRRADSVVLVVPLRLRAMTAARSLLARHEELGPRLHVVAREPSPGGLDAADLRAAVDRAVVTTIPDEPGRAGEEERAELPGRPSRGAPARLVRDLLHQLVPQRRAA